MMDNYPSGSTQCKMEKNAVNLNKIPLVSITAVQMIPSDNVSYFEDNSFNFVSDTYVDDNIIISSNKDSFVKIYDLDDGKTFSDGSTIVNVCNDVLQNASGFKKQNEYMNLSLKSDLHPYPTFINKKSPISKKRKRSLSTTNRYKLYCLHCNKVQPKIRGIDTKKCDVCNNCFQFECSKCSKKYNSIYGIYNHLKRECTKEPELKTLNIDSKLTEYKYPTVNLEKIDTMQMNSSKCRQLCFDCGVTNNNTTDHDKLCKALKAFFCYVCTFKCCNKNNLKCHMKNEHHISTNLQKMSKPINSSKENSQERSVRVENRKKDIEMYCSICDNAFQPNNVLCRRENCRLCNTLLIYQCRICKKRYTGQSSIYNHLKYECNNKAQYKCTFCNYSAKQKGNLQAHIERKHSIKKCTGCGEIFDNYCKYRNHQIQNCTNEALFNCSFCSFRTVFKTQLKDHVRLEHKSRYVCFKCGKKYKNLESLNKHQKDVCGSESVFECDHCTYNSHTKGYLKKHIKSNHQEIFSFKDIF